MNKYLLIASIALIGSISVSAQVEDDIYFNPKKDSSAKMSSKAKSNYIANYQDIDVDEYNRRGQYYTSPVDTIGYNAETAQDFVYTTQIQKYYNPTIVIENEALLADVLDNSYGNVNIEFNLSGYPVFGTYWGLPISYWSRNYWSITPSWYNWNYWNPWYGSSLAWNWGPSWGWGPSWSFGWGPSWGPTWGPVWSPGWWGYSGPGYYADYRPGGNRPVGARPGWTAGARPGGNYYGNHTVGYRPSYGVASGNRPGNSGRPTSVAPNPGYTIGAGGHRYPANSNNQSTVNNARPNPSQTSTARPGGASNSNTNKVNTGGYRQTGEGAYRSNSNTGNSNRGTTNNSYRKESTSTWQNSTPRNSSTVNRSSGGNYGGGSRSTGSGRGGGFSNGSRGGRR